MSVDKAWELSGLTSRRQAHEKRVTWAKIRSTHEWSERSGPIWVARCMKTMIYCISRQKPSFLVASTASCMPFRIVTQGCWTFFSPSRNTPGFWTCSIAWTFSTLKAGRCMRSSCFQINLLCNFHYLLLLLRHNKSFAEKSCVLYPLQAVELEKKWRSWPWSQLSVWLKQLACSTEDKTFWSFVWVDASGSFFFILLPLKLFRFDDHLLSLNEEHHSRINRKRVTDGGKAATNYAFLNIRLGSTGNTHTRMFWGLTVFQHLSNIICLFTYDVTDVLMLWRCRVKPF